VQGLLISVSWLVVNFIDLNFIRLELIKVIQREFRKSSLMFIVVLRNHTHELPEQQYA
jgi:hypothetical protein